MMANCHYEMAAAGVGIIAARNSVLIAGETIDVADDGVVCSIIISIGGQRWRSLTYQLHRHLILLIVSGLYFIHHLPTSAINLYGLLDKPSHRRCSGTLPYYSTVRAGNDTSHWRKSSWAL